MNTGLQGGVQNRVRIGCKKEAKNDGKGRLGCSTSGGRTSPTIAAVGVLARAFMCYLIQPLNSANPGVQQMQHRNNVLAFEPKKEPGYFGGCPYCGSDDGLVHLGPEQPMACKRHRVKWSIGINLFSIWQWIAEEHPDYPEWACALLAAYREVEPQEAKNNGEGGA